MQGKLCQSCGMPMGDTDELYGTEKDGAKSPDYCRYCYADGAFLADCTMDQMIDFCVKPMVENSPGMTEPIAREMMKGFFPTLKRWKQA
ncbi:MAG: transcriptional regulator [Clostridiales bacterium]|nr:transcriptional regulator [Clostridiales bacterium]